jgi:hypothetical protein
MRRRDFIKVVAGSAVTRPLALNDEAAVFRSLGFGSSGSGFRHDTYILTRGRFRLDLPAPLSTPMSVEK